MQKLLERLGRARRDVLAVLVLVIASMTLTTIHVHEHQQISPIDEYVYIDYYAEVLHVGVVREGSEVGTFARGELGCRGTRLIDLGHTKRLCLHPASVPDTKLPLGGLSSADIYTPLYFLSARLIAQPFVWMGMDLVEAGRLAGGVWLSLAAVLLYAAMRRMRVHRVPAIGVGLVLLSSLPAYWGNSYISTDATAFAAGALMVLLTTYLAGGVRRWPALVFLVMSPIVTWFKFQNAIAVGLAGLTLILMALRDARLHESRWGQALRRALRDRRTWVALGGAGAAVAAQVVWLVVRADLAVGPASSFGIGAPLHASDLAHDMFAFLPVSLSAVDIGWPGNPIFSIGALLVLGGLFSGLMGAQVSALHRRLAVSGLVVGLLAGPALSLAVWRDVGGYVTLSQRYGISILPALLVCAGVAASAGPRGGRWFVLGTGVCSVLLSLALTG